MEPWPLKQFLDLNLFANPECLELNDAQDPVRKGLYKNTYEFYC